MELAVSVKDLEKRFEEFVAVDKISFDVERGKIFGFLGPNGAGKSTTIRMLCGIMTPSSGKGTVGGYDILTESERIKETIGYMSQKFSLYEDLTVEENIDFFSGIYRVPKALKAEKKKWVVTMAGLQHELHTRTGILSGGWKQRLALGCAILHDPSILFLDEPTSGVDPISRRHFWHLIKGLAEKGVTVFVTTHYMDEAEYFDEIAFIYGGQIIARGSPAELKANVMKESVLKIFCENSQEILPKVLALSSVKDAYLFGGGIHLISENLGTATQEIKRIFDRERAVFKMEPSKPSLEDVFIYLIEAQLASGV